MSYLGAFTAEIPILHEIWMTNGDVSNHGNAVYTFGEPIVRFAICVYPLHKIPHHDPVSADYAARAMIDFIMEVPDASLFSKGDQVTWDGRVYVVEGQPFDWGSQNPFGLDKTMFGGSIHITRVT